MEDISYLDVESTMLCLENQQDDHPHSQISSPLGKPDSILAGAGGTLRYHPLKTLGEGGMGRVVHYWDSDLLRDVAAKHLHALGENERALAHFLWESRVTAHLDHPNVIPVYDLGTTKDGKPYLIMKKAAGKSLDTILARVTVGDPSARGQYTLPRRLRVFLEVCFAIEYAHSRGVLHRDIKPGNIVLGEHGECWVGDWGLSVPLRGGLGKEISSIYPHDPDRYAAGTPGYASPEQMSGERLDVRSDVYSLGVLLFQVISLKDPSQFNSFRLQSRSLKRIVEKATASHPDERYSTVKELRQDVELYLEGKIPIAQSTSPWQSFIHTYLRPSGLLVAAMPIELEVAWLVFFTLGVLTAKLLNASWTLVALLSVVCLAGLVVVVIQRVRLRKGTREI